MTEKVPHKKRNDYEKDNKLVSPVPQIKCDLSHNRENFHHKMDNVHGWLLQVFWGKHVEADLYQYLDNELSHFQTNGFPDVGIAAMLQGLNIICCHRGDKIFLQKLKKLQQELTQFEGADKHIFSACLQQLMCLPYLAKNKLGKASQKLDEVDKTLSSLIPCEWTAWYFRSRASFCLQSAWMSTDNVRNIHKRNAKMNFELCREHFSKAAERNPSCQYLKFLATVSLINIIFMNLKFCWYMFDQRSMEKKFIKFMPTPEHLKEAEKLIGQVEREAQDIANNTLWKHDINYHIEEVQFFYHYRKAQLHKCSESAKIAEDKTQILLKDYQNATNSKVLQQFSRIASSLCETLSKESCCVQRVHLSEYASSISSNKDSTDNCNELSNIDSLSSESGVEQDSDTLQDSEVLQQFPEIASSLCETLSKKIPTVQRGHISDDATSNSSNKDSNIDGLSSESGLDQDSDALQD